jgi:hypothetical protein
MCVRRNVEFNQAGGRKARQHCRLGGHRGEVISVKVQLL